jgi:hypothetical protein
MVCVIGKAKAFRNESGKAALKGKVAQKNKNLGTSYATLGLGGIL